MKHLLLLLTFLALAACADRDAANAPLASPWSEDGAPARLQHLAHDLEIYLGETGRMPATLATMDALHLSTGGPYTTNRYAYHGAGIALLRDGWRVVAIDDRRAEPGRVWCVIRPAVRVARAPRFRVVLVTIAELRETGA